LDNDKLKHWRSTTLDYQTLEVILIRGIYRITARDVNSEPEPVGHRLDPIILAHAEGYHEETPRIMAVDDEAMAAVLKLL
jgi:hypothetical protein